MVQLAMLAAAWVLMRRYTSRRRTRLDRESVVSQLTEKLRSMAKLSRSQRRKNPQKSSSLATQST
jgi:hypothetical protein